MILVVAVALVHFLAYCAFIKNYSISPGTKDGLREGPLVVFYLSPHRALNAALYVVFFPWVQVTVSGTASSAFAHGPEALWGAIAIENKEGEMPRPVHWYTPERPVAVVIWAAIGILALLWVLGTASLRTRLVRL